MRDLAIAAARSDPELREHAIRISTGLAMSGPVDAAQAIENFIRSAYVFVDEPDELLIDPSLQLEMLGSGGSIYGDCDDAALLAATLLYLIGQRVRFKAINRTGDGSYTHVFMEYWHENLKRWIPVDPTIDGIPVYNRGDFITEEI